MICVALYRYKLLSNQSYKYATKILIKRILKYLLAIRLMRYQKNNCINHKRIYDIVDNFKFLEKKTLYNKSYLYLTTIIFLFYFCTNIHFFLTSIKTLCVWITNPKISHFSNEFNYV